MKRIALVVVALASLSVVVAGQTGTKNGEWPTYGGDLGNTRYSPLDQINAATSARSKWRGASRPTTSVPGRSSICNRRR